LLVGHSLGGLTSIDVLTKFPKLFNAYIAIDPSMWYNNEVHLKNTIAQFPNQNMNGNRLFVGTANTMPQNMTLSQLKTDTSIETLHIRSIFGLIDFLKTNTNGLAYSNKYYEKENHNSVPLLSEYDGLKFIFDFYQVNLTEKDFIDSTALIASTLKTHYAEVTKKMGYKNAAPETFINYLAYDALGKNHFEKASALFNLNAEWYPESNNVYDSYADYYLVIKDTTNAITNYKKALQINNSESTLGKLNKISKSDKNGFTIEYLQRYAGVYTVN
jgi:tetratricopeptide (TPR) repeat protein